MRPVIRTAMSGKEIIVRTVWTKISVMKIVRQGTSITVKTKPRV